MSVNVTVAEVFWNKLQTMRKQTSFLFFSPVHAKNEIYLFLRYPEPRMQWKFGFLVENPSSSAGSQLDLEILRIISTNFYFFFQLMKLGQKMLGKKLFGEIMKRTFYGQFVAGPVFSFSMSNIHDNNYDDDMQKK